PPREGDVVLRCHVEAAEQQDRMPVPRRLDPPEGRLVDPQIRRYADDLRAEIAMQRPEFHADFDFVLQSHHRPRRVCATIWHDPSAPGRRGNPFGANPTMRIWRCTGVVLLWGLALMPTLSHAQG